MNDSHRGRWQLLLIAALFLGSFAIAALLRFGGWQPGHTRNYGELLSPPVELGALVGRDGDGETIRWRNDEQHWILLARAPVTCDDACRAELALLENVRTAQGRHADHLRLFRLADPRDLPLPPLSLEGPLPAPFATPAPATQPELWLLDPHGFVVMHYAAGYDPNGLRRDLARLLR